ncbi:MAG TPA: twin-arginine translocase TatA/TatE family subunit [Bacteroidia bacterium]|nr:twin-arginine translocase TatA/TatE family subunit [Bacteroidia bacterium]MCE7955144.1 twin-arginine translocase TatA/TatE family subunit [Bacteroidetes bacterium CHB6]HNR49610.1 twin-arginine translocase TatA/TatE family subunit [Bacteroidia bacterium]HNT83118.1 twin-arginine translocase TatA/TatE family subunit [Bacteroidia bacterium]
MLSMLLFLDNLGGGELLVILVFVLFFFGSKKVPDLARGLGRASREFKDAMNGVQREIEESMKTPPVAKKEISEAEKPLPEEINVPTDQKSEISGTPPSNSVSRPQKIE